MEIVVVVETTASGLLFSYFFLITMAADAIAAAVDVAAMVAADAITAVAARLHLPEQL